MVVGHDLAGDLIWCCALANGVTDAVTVTIALDVVVYNHARYIPRVHTIMLRCWHTRQGTYHQYVSYYILI